MRRWNERAGDRGRYERGRGRVRLVARGTRVRGGGLGQTAARAGPCARRNIFGAHTAASITPLPSIVAQFLAERFDELPLVLPPGAHVRLIQEAATAAIAGGSIHDALIAATVRHAKARLPTRDRRAAIVYKKLGTDFEIVG